MDSLDEGLGEIGGGEEVRWVLGEFFCGAGSGLFFRVVGAEVGMVADTRSAAAAAIREGERTQGHAVLCTERGHKGLWGTKAGRAEARPYTGKPGVQNRNAPARPKRNFIHRYCTTTVMRVKLKKIRGQRKKSQKPQRWTEGRGTSTWPRVILSTYNVIRSMLRV